MELAISIVVGIFLIEAYAWLPKISEWLVERAVSHLLIEADQARCREEWKAGLDELPNSGLKILHALSFFLAARSINADSMEAKLEQIGDELEVLSDQHARKLQQLRTIKTKSAQSQAMRKRLARVVDESVASLRAIEVPTSLVTGSENNARNAQDVVNALEKAVKAAENLERLMVVAVNRAGDITDSKVDIVTARIEQIDTQIRTVRAAHSDAIGLHRKRKLEELRPVLKTLNDDLRTLKGMEVDEVDEGEHEVTEREYRRIMAALQGVLHCQLSGKQKLDTR